MRRPPREVHVARCGPPAPWPPARRAARWRRCAAHSPSRCPSDSLRRHDLVDEAPARGGRGVDRIAGEQHLHADRIGQLPQDPLRAAVAGDDAALDLGEAEGRVLRGERGCRSRRASVMPPPRQWPLTAAITGFQTSRPRLRSWSFCVSHISSRPERRWSTKLLMSAPAVKARSPAPVTMATRIGVVVAHAAPGLGEAAVMLGVHGVQPLGAVDRDERRRRPEGQSRSTSGGSRRVCAAEEIAGDHHAVDLRRPFADALDAQSRDTSARAAFPWRRRGRRTSGCSGRRPCRRSRSRRPSRPRRRP